MRSLFQTLALVIAVSATTAPSAMAGGWQGGEHWKLRAEFSQGYTLTRVWLRLNSR